MGGMRARLLPLLITALVLFLALPSLVEFYTDWLWFGELGYQHVFLRILTARSWIVCGSSSSCSGSCC
jgi:uncharacterized membrane protein (UPF0182 family)